VQPGRVELAGALELIFLSGFITHARDVVKQGGTAGTLVPELGFLGFLFY
jgi:hypothetical protein